MIFDTQPKFPNVSKSKTDILLQKFEVLNQAVLNVQNNKEVKMDHTTAQREHLRSRARSIKNEKSVELRKHFHLYDDASPKTLEELLERLNSGKYVWDKERYKDRQFYGVEEVAARIQWRDPSKPADEKGFNAAAEVLEKAYTELKDTLMIVDPKEGLEALRAFEAKSFS